MHVFAQGTRLAAYAGPCAGHTALLYHTGLH